MRIHKLVLALALAVIVTACGSKPKQEAPSALVIKAQQVGKLAAQAVAETDHTDTLAMQNSILAAKAQQAEFQVARDTAAVNAFNRAFKQYLQENDAALADEMFAKRPANLPDDEPWDEFEQLVEDPEPAE